MCSVQRNERRRETLEQRLAPLLARQHGVFSRAQAMDAGATRGVIMRRLRAARWEPLHPGVYRIAGGASTWHQALMAACIAWGEGTVVSHRAAGAMWRLPGFQPGFLEVTVPRGRKRANVTSVVAHHLAVPGADRTAVERVPVTTPARTLLDLMAVAPPTLVEEALDDAVRRQLVSIARMRWQLERTARSGRRGIAALRALLEQRDDARAIPQSVLETRMAALLRRAGLPEPVRQHEVRDGRRLVAVVDFAYPATKIAIETDGYRWHGGKRRWERDLHRRNALTLLGWRVVHVTWADVASRPEQLVEQLRSLM